MLQRTVWCMLSRGLRPRTRNTTAPGLVVTNVVNSRRSQCFSIFANPTARSRHHDIKAAGSVVMKDLPPAQVCRELLLQA